MLPLHIGRVPREEAAPPLGRELFALALDVLAAMTAARTGSLPGGDNLAWTLWFPGRWNHPCRFSVVFIQAANCVAATAKKETNMNWDRVEGNWKQFKGQIQQQWGKLTDDDLDKMKGTQTELAGRLQERYGIARDDAEKQINDWLSRH